MLCGSRICILTSFRIGFKGNFYVCSSACPTAYAAHAQPRAQHVPVLRYFAPFFKGLNRAVSRSANEVQDPDGDQDHTTQNVCFTGQHRSCFFADREAAHADHEGDDADDQAG